MFHELVKFQIKYILMQKMSICISKNIDNASGTARALYTVIYDIRYM